MGSILTSPKQDEAIDEESSIKDQRLVTRKSPPIIDCQPHNDVSEATSMAQQTARPHCKSMTQPRICQYFRPSCRHASARFTNYLDLPAAVRMRIYDFAFDLSPKQLYDDYHCVGVEVYADEYDWEYPTDYDYDARETLRELRLASRLG